MRIRKAELCIHAALLIFFSAATGAGVVAACFGCTGRLTRCAGCAACVFTISFVDVTRPGGGNSYVTVCDVKQLFFVVGLWWLVHIPGY